MILAIETSTPQASLALFDENHRTVSWRHQFTTERSHNSKIFTPLEEALAHCDRKLDAVAVGIGPGSYSGIRVGIAAANGIALAIGCPVIGVSSLEAYAPDLDTYHVVGDARRKTYFIATIHQGRLSGEPDLLHQEEFSDRLATLSHPVFSMDLSMTESFERIEHRYPLAENLTQRLSREAIRNAALKPIEPHYLRPPYITKAKKKPVPGFPQKK